MLHADFIFSTLHELAMTKLLISSSLLLASTHRAFCFPVISSIPYFDGNPRSLNSLSDGLLSDAATVGPDLPSVDVQSKRLFLVRHGEVINPGGDRPVYYGAMDVPLSPLGEEEAKAAAAYLQQFDLQYVASSPLSRAVFGAEQVRSKQQDDDTEIAILDGFKELDRGSWCGKTLDEIGPDMMARFDACDESVTPDGGESYPFLMQRVLAARDELLEKMEPGSSAAVVSHLQVTRSMLSNALGIPIEEMTSLKVATASVTCIDYCTISKEQTVHYQSFKPDVGLEQSKDGAN